MRCGTIVLYTVISLGHARELVLGYCRCKSLTKIPFGIVPEIKPIRTDTTL